MIKKLTVNNFVIIENISLNFNNGMTVITGETGAGKSLIIDTINLLLGERADNDMIRDGASYALVEGIFDTNDKINDLLDKYNINKNEDIIIERIISNTKNQIKINGNIVTLQILKNISRLLADIHIQNDTMRLFNPDTYLDLLDPKNNNEFTKLLNSYTKALYDYEEKMKVYELVLKGQKETLDRLEFLEYEHKELDELNLYPNIDKELEEDINKLENFDKVSSNLNQAYEYLENNNFSALDSIYDASKCLEKISNYDEKYLEFKEKLLDTYYISSEIKDEISKEINSLDYDEDELNIKTEKLNDINKAKEKYKKSVDELIEYNKKIALDIEMVTNYDEVLKEKKEDVIKSHKELVKYANLIHEYRLKIASKMEKGIIKECLDLDLNNSLFNIKIDNADTTDPFNKTIFNSKGIDTCNFLISFNKGESLKPLHKVASGGEASRIMLAFKSYFADKSDVSLMIFDEIDTGVSGITAKKIADKMYEISKKLQVICITHLPQVAARGDYHKFIYKEEINNRTYTKVNDLDYDKRVEEIATMLSGDRLSLYAIEHAKELLNIK